MADYQLIVIGAGPGGYEAALRAAKLGKKVAVVERREAGGTCLNRGCIPTKTLLHASAIYRDAKKGAHCGIHTEDIHADMAEIFAYKRAVSQKLSAGIETLFKTAKIDLLRGTALITGSGCVRVTDADGSANDYTCDDILIATGSVPSRPPISGLELAMTSDELLEGCDHLYRSIVIIGGGVIGIEFATFYADLGCAVTVIEGMDRLLPSMDKELGQNLALILKKQGVKVFTNAMVQRVEQAGEDLAVYFTCKETEETVSGEAVLCAIGRRAYCDGLFADGVGVEMNGRSIAVNANFETSLPHVYAIGDVSSKIQLAHVATAQGIACVERLCGVQDHTDLSVVPSCIYCRPEIAVVGLTRQGRQARHVRQRQDGHRRPGPLLHEACRPRRNARACRRAAHVRACERHDRRRGAGARQPPDRRAVLPRDAPAPLLRGGHDRRARGPVRKARLTSCPPRSGTDRGERCERKTPQGQMALRGRSFFAVCGQSR
mgnify:CR=1 FL=1